MVDWLTQLKTKWRNLSWHLPVLRARRWREAAAHLDGDGENDETFPLWRAATSGMVVYASFDALFYQKESLFLDGDAEVGARRSISRPLRLIRSIDGFIAVNPSSQPVPVRTLPNDEMPQRFFAVYSASGADEMIVYPAQDDN